ncbi:MAG: hypothetical protein Q7R60_02345 [bacterium]|nr:hypothetical protein [bacterium]
MTTGIVIAVDFDKELAGLSDVEGPQVVAGLMVDYYRQHGSVYLEALRRLEAVIDNPKEIKALLRDVGLPDAMMACAQLRARQGSADDARRIIDRVSRTFGESCARQLDDKHGVSVAMVAAST